MSTLRILRLALSGALAGVALVGLFLGGTDSATVDLGGAAAGFAAALGAIKLLHLV